MKLVDNWKQVAKESWAIHAGLTALALFLVSEALYLITERQIVHPIVMGWTILGLMAWGCIARLFKQHMDKRVARWRRYRFSLLVFTAVAAVTWATSAPAMGLWPRSEAPSPPPAVSTEITGLPYSDGDFYAVSLPLIAKWEGKRNQAYLDKIASPPRPTICHGETEGVVMGEYRTDEECTEGLRKGVRRYRSGLHQYILQSTREQHLTPNREAAFVSLAWNVGIAGAGRSTAVRYLNAGDIVKACRSIGMWNKAGGRVVVGLVNRRTDEIRVCLA